MGTSEDCGADSPVAWGGYALFVSRNHTGSTMSASHITSLSQACFVRTTSGYESHAIPGKRGHSLCFWHSNHDSQQVFLLELLVIVIFLADCWNKGSTFISLNSSLRHNILPFWHIFDWHLCSAWIPVCLTCVHLGKRAIPVSEHSSQEVRMWSGSLWPGDAFSWS